MQGQFWKTFGGASADAGRAQERGARGARPAGGGVAAALLPGTRPAAPGDLTPRNRAIYYVWPTSPDHDVSGKNKTAGRRPAVFAKYGGMVEGSGLNVVDGPVPWRQRRAQPTEGARK